MAHSRADVTLCETSPHRNCSSAGLRFTSGVRLFLAATRRSPEQGSPCVRKRFLVHQEDDSRDRFRFAGVLLSSGFVACVHRTCTHGCESSVDDFARARGVLNEIFDEIQISTGRMIAAKNNPRTERTGRAAVD